MGSEYRQPGIKLERWGGGGRCYGNGWRSSPADETWKWECVGWKRHAYNRCMNTSFDEDYLQTAAGGVMWKCVLVFLIKMRNNGVEKS